MGATTFFVYRGVDKGIEKLSRVAMPVLLLLIVGISVFSLCLKYTDASGVTRTGLQGMMVYVVPDFSGMTFKQFMVVLTDAMGQLFYSISVAMGIMVAYGSYVPKEMDLVKSVNRIEICDTIVAFLAGMMIIPAVFTFMGAEGMSASGPALMFKALPKVFEAMGSVVGGIVGIVFFLTVFFAAVTSSVSVMEAVVSSTIDQFGWKRERATFGVLAVTVIMGTLVCLGYNVLYFEFTLPNGAVAQILDILDYISNYIMMTVVAIATCIFIGWVVKPKTIIEEVNMNGHKFRREKVFVLMIKFVTPVMLTLLLLQALGLIRF